MAGDDLVEGWTLHGLAFIPRRITAALMEGRGRAGNFCELKNISGSSEETCVVHNHDYLTHAKALRSACGA